MRMHVLAAVALAAAVAATAAAQTTTKPPKTNPLALVGCVSEDEENPGQLTFADVKDGTVYRLSGADAREYVGRRVQVVGATDSKRVKVRGGLGPSPNAAAQAGSIDPTQAAMAAQGSTTRGVGSGELPEFRVKALKPAKGDCPPAKK